VFEAKLVENDRQLGVNANFSRAAFISAVKHRIGRPGFLSNLIFWGLLVRSLNLLGAMLLQKAGSVSRPSYYYADLYYNCF
jgi:hypothetical protein